MIKTSLMLKSANNSAIRQVKHILERLIGELNIVLGGDVAGIYLYGSVIDGDFDFTVSDIDLVVVLEAELDEQGFAALKQMHWRVVGDHPEWDDRLELAYLSRGALKTFREETSTIGIISPGEPFHLIQAGNDWLISWYALRENGVALQGPPIQTLIDPIPQHDWLNAVKIHICHYRESVKSAPNKPYLSYIVLTVARGIFTLEHRQSTSKIKAAEWARRNYPQWSDLIERALRWRHDPAADSLTIERIRPQIEAYLKDLLSGLSC